MDIGMMWMDDDKRTTLEEKIQRAAEYYQDKYGRLPNLCLVNLAMLDGEKQVGAIEVRPVRNVLPNYFWLGLKPTGVSQ
ncbi:MAG: hypothetical protein L0332_23035 [Chloroflexi bacterium]|nr:hypothetical protein [Chloroflexota bacterium]MCI0578554.1 hypothetical protein [Chloroflexota bacterium]MCI0648326.1 hypothetical protein [Chloroflexota bacterium]MCI0729567.1 hypothetical protein [Chloroflexota bacterium]